MTDSERLDSIEKSMARIVAQLDAANPTIDALRAVLDMWSNDMHQHSSRPCETCRVATKVMGKPMGCYAYQALFNRPKPEGK